LGKKNGIQAKVLLLAPPSAETIKQRPDLSGKSGNGDSHIMPVVGDNAIDFTVRQFPGQNRSYDQPLITKLNQVKQIYNKLGGYFTDKPEWFNDGESYYFGEYESMPSFFDISFPDDLM